LEGPLVPGGLLGGLFSFLLGTQLPGPGTNYMKQELTYFGKAMPGEALTASVEITRLRPEKNLVDLEARCRRENGELICQGRSLVLVKDLGA
jgi:acyl dehydratase